jgi:ABC-type transporter Mla subunit MlaD
MPETDADLLTRCLDALERSQTLLTEVVTALHDAHQGQQRILDTLAPFVATLTSRSDALIVRTELLTVITSQHDQRLEALQQILVSMRELMADE